MKQFLNTIENIVGDIVEGCINAILSVTEFLVAIIVLIAVPVCTIWFIWLIVSLLK